MTVAARRTEIAAVIDQALIGIKVRPYKTATAGAKPRDGWLEINQVDTEDATYGEVRLSMTLIIPVAGSRQQFEQEQDDLVVPIISAVKAAGGRAPVINLAAISMGQADIYCLSTTFLTECEAA